MKKAYIVLFTSLVTAASFGQSIHRAVFNSIGANIGGNGQTKMILSVGEPIIGIKQGSGVVLGQGFLGGDIKKVVSPTGVENITSDEATVYPNPVTNTLRIKSDKDNIQVSVSNTMGQEVYNGTYQNEGIDISNLTTGLYFVHVMSDNKIISNTKIVKQ